ncbi:MAG: hypothetical protein CL940_13075 [Deltaproteobacteria bacterium]|nr:hypothetical protein [Deltaproteobacteria bacterium]
MVRAFRLHEHGEQAMRTLLVFILMAAVVACGGTDDTTSATEPTPDGTTDVASEDVSPADTAVGSDVAMDTVEPSDVTEDAAPADAAVVDAGVIDAAPSDVATPDATPSDVAAGDAVVDAGGPDSSTPDAAIADASGDASPSEDVAAEDVAAEDVAAPEGCTADNDGESCDDGDPCTMEDACDGGVCTGWPKDLDQDGYVDESCGGDDCDDEDMNVAPGMIEICDGKKNDCTASPKMDEQPWEAENLNVSCGYCNFMEYQCDPGAPLDYYSTCWPGYSKWDSYTEICDDDMDNDCDGSFDEAICE